MITSHQNRIVQRFRILLNRRQEREEERSFVVEGVRLVEEALLAGWRPKHVMFSSQLSARGVELVHAFAERGVEVDEVTERLMSSIAGTEAPQGLMVEFPMRELKLPEPVDFIVVADALRDPGNLGTLLRTASAAGAQAVVLAPGTVDPYSPKVLRSAMGAHFHLPIRQMSWPQLQLFCKEDIQPGLKIYLSDAEGGSPCWQLDLKKPLALVVGGEAEGASDEARQLKDEIITIPMPGRRESLNAAVAAGVLMFEVVRQRSV